MGFASGWLKARALFPDLIKEIPDDRTGIIVVVPASGELLIDKMLDSLSLCEPPGCKTEVLIIINAKPGADVSFLRDNRICADKILAWKKAHRDCFFQVYFYDTGQPEIKGWGVGLARKTGMDEALLRFDKINRPQGIIACLDADCTTEKNYFVSLCNAFQPKNKSACSVYFEHPLTGPDYPDKIYGNITIYELYLRYYLQALHNTLFPYAFHTIGSCVAVKAEAYMKAGGMNRRQAGEDFYFIQKLVSLGGYFSLNTTTVFPSPRESMRVPFGTGVTIKRLMTDEKGSLATYNIKAFRALRDLFGSVDALFGCKPSEVQDYYKTLSPGLRSFIAEEELTAKISEINANVAGQESFMKRFFIWFNMFRIVKFLNHVHPAFHEKQDIRIAAREMLMSAGIYPSSDSPQDLLAVFRTLEKNSEWLS